MHWDYGYWTVWASLLLYTKDGAGMGCSKSRVPSSSGSDSDSGEVHVTRISSYSEYTNRLNTPSAWIAFGVGDPSCLRRYKHINRSCSRPRGVILVILSEIVGDPGTSHMGLEGGQGVTNNRVISYCWEDSTMGEEWLGGGGTTTRWSAHCWMMQLSVCLHFGSRVGMNWWYTVRLFVIGV